MKFSKTQPPSALALSPSPDLPIPSANLDLWSLVNLDETQFDKALAHALLPTSPTTTTSIAETINNNSNSNNNNNRVPDTLNTPSPVWTPLPYCAMPAQSPSDTTSSMDCVIPITNSTDLNEYLSSTSTITYQGTSRPTRQDTYQGTSLSTSQVTYQGTALEPENSNTEISMANDQLRQLLPTLVGDLTTSNNNPVSTPISSNLNPIPSNLTPISSNLTPLTSNLTSLSSSLSHILSYPTTLSQETCITLSLPVIDCQPSMEYPRLHLEEDVTMEDNVEYVKIIVIDPENEDSKMDLGPILRQCEIVSENYVMSSKLSEEDDKKNLQHLVSQQTFKTPTKSNGRGRPVKTKQDPIAPKVDRKNAKFMDSKELEKKRKQRKIDLNRDASKRYREAKKQKIEEQLKVLPIEVARNESLKTKLARIEMQVKTMRKWKESNGF